MLAKTTFLAALALSVTAYAAPLGNNWLLGTSEDGGTTVGLRISPVGSPGSITPSSSGVYNISPGTSWTFEYFIQDTLPIPNGYMSVGFNVTDITSKTTLYNNVFLAFKGFPNLNDSGLPDYDQNIQTMQSFGLPFNSADTYAFSLFVRDENPDRFYTYFDPITNKNVTDSQFADIVATASPTAPITQTPEPSTLALLGVSVLFLIKRRTYV